MKLITVWVFVIAICFYVVKFTSIGPIIYTFSAEYGIGVHAGDILILIPLLAAMIYTVIFFRKRKAVN